MPFIKGYITVSTKLLSSTTVFNFDNKKVSWAPKQHIKMISEGSCDTEDWSNDCWKFSFAITRINYILKYTEMEKRLFFIVIIFHNITVVTVF